MPAIAGIASPNRTTEVIVMLDRLRHRGPLEPVVAGAFGLTLGASGSSAQPRPLSHLPDSLTAAEEAGPGRFARAGASPAGLCLQRDPLGAAPLYYGWTASGELCFASEVKALAGHTRLVYELPPGCRFDGRTLTRQFALEPQPELTLPPEDLAAGLHSCLDQAVQHCLTGFETGAWLSGGLDSSAITALARAHLPHLHTFAAGLAGAPDLAFAREAAAYLDCDHHEAVLTLSDLLSALDQVIYHLESFDALLVRSSLTHYHAARLAADFVPAVFSGEGGDELFAGYASLKTVPPARLADELLDLTGRLHNTALQRVDRCAAAFGLTPHTPFIDPAVVDYALRIPVEYKLRSGVEKWILRRALQGCLPASILDRPKAKFWEGAGVGDLLSQHAEQAVTTADFHRQRRLPNGWLLNTKEELLYYRIFQQHFDALEDLSWMGRTKGAPKEE